MAVKIIQLMNPIKHLYYIHTDYFNIYTKNFILFAKTVFENS